MASTVFYSNPGSVVWGLIAIEYDAAPRVLGVRATEAVPVSRDHLTGRRVVRCRCFDEVAAANSDAEAREMLAAKIRVHLNWLIGRGELEARLAELGWVRIDDPAEGRRLRSELLGGSDAGMVVVTADISVERAA